MDRGRHDGGNSAEQGGLYVALPPAYALHSKGAKLGGVFALVGASAVCRVPTTIFGASFLGIKFTVVRFLVSLPLIGSFHGCLAPICRRRPTV